MRDDTFRPDAFRALRKARGFTLAGLAKRAGTSVSYVKYLEAGTCEPSDPYAEAFARALDCTTADFSTPKTRAA